MTLTKTNFIIKTKKNEELGMKAGLTDKMLELYLY